MVVGSALRQGLRRISGVAVFGGTERAEGYLRAESTGPRTKNMTMKPLLLISFAVAASCVPATFAQDVEVVEVPVVPAPGTGIDVDTDVAPAATLPDDKADLDDPITKQIAASPGLSKLQTLIEAAEFESRLNAEGPITFFAPNNTAFRDMSDEEFQQLLLPTNKERLVKLLERHIVDGPLAARDMETGALETASGEQVLVVVEGESITVGEANLTMADLAASNGSFHMIDHILKTVPSDARK
ncbi:beta-Ig-H3/fasciclin protein [Haloferula helveola]|uniref:Beta-Ig-H3/fasciclin protein n=2 Tax=Haloferula helveola TaxID=490095 RepID=A0ABM7RBZ4_9BACT|nr:beta-Ig-H3/fasciclin protein [Haloferula helveola]